MRPLFPVSDRYAGASRSGGAQSATCAAYVSGAVLPAASDLPIVSGSVTDTSAPGVRRTLDLEVAPVPGLFDALAPIGVQLRPMSVLRYPNGDTETIPMGRYEIVSVSRGYGPDGSITINASDRWVTIQRARFQQPFASTPGLRVTEQIVALLLGGLGTSEAVTVTASSTATVGALVWDQDRDKAILDLAESIGAWVFFDRNGVPTVADLPTSPNGLPVWSVDAGAAGVLLSADRGRDRDRTYNVVVVNSEKVDGTALFDPVIVADTDPTSPTYYLGPFGQVPYFYSSPLLQTTDQATGAAKAILQRVSGMNAQLRVTSVRNHALDALDSINVQLPQERYDIGIPVERHLIDKLTHPLTPNGVQQIDTRSTRPDAT